MSPRRDLNQIVGSAARNASSLEFVIVHEDFSRGLVARQLLEQLFVTESTEGKQAFKMWEFGTLRLLNARAQAVREAAAASVVCLSAHGDNSLMVGVKDWAERWGREPATVPCALIVLLENVDRSHSGNTPMVQFLRNAANQRGAAFLLCTTHACELEENAANKTRGLCNLAQ